MEEQKIISGNNEQEIWAQITADLTANDDILTYDVLINQAGRQVELYIDIDPGGGFEGSSEITQFTAPLSVSHDFRFAIHDQGFLDSIGKFFGLEDIILGYPELDEHVVIKTNAREKISELFADADVRNVFSHLNDFHFGIHNHTLEDTDADQPFLEFNISEAVTDPGTLRQIYHAFYVVLTGLEK